MKVEINKDRLFIVPETDFEIDWIHSKFELGRQHDAWLKTGLSTSDLLGIIVVPTLNKPEALNIEENVQNQKHLLSQPRNFPLKEGKETIYKEEINDY